MNVFPHLDWYVGGNFIEAWLWISCGLYFAVKAFQAKPLLWFYPALAITFVLFGSSDFAECALEGPLPWWLWVWKIVGGLALFGLLIVEDYHNRGKPALAPYRFVAAGVILALAVLCIIRQR